MVCVLGGGGGGSNLKDQEGAQEQAEHTQCHQDLTKQVIHPGRLECTEPAKNN